MGPTILVTGGTGTLGGHVVRMLTEQGLPVRVLSRSERPSADGVEYVTGDLRENTGIDAALDGIGTVLNLAGGPKGDDEVARNISRAASEAEVRHLVHISVVGADRMPLGYLRTQLAAERAVIGSGVPWTVLRAAQFHDLVFGVARAMAKLPVVPAPTGLRFQPVASEEVAARLVELALAGPSGRADDLVGPEVLTMPDLVRDYLRLQGKRRPFLPFPLPGAAGRAYRSGLNLTLDGADVGKRTWSDFLAARVG
ncbi:SDR family oxidoreductase [Nocardiopsis ganjiahuensis]|uniref:SDR family oxidoreductase n=1 Tax=Nocardiopsis ganjiahuensis TaxID=239984 RepID=UPI000477303A|nr:NAD(P)H-binding protein [Nocardiopsis ganjiahuensis]